MLSVKQQEEQKIRHIRTPPALSPYGDHNQRGHQMETTVGALSPPACQAPTRRAQLLSSILHTMTARCIMCCHLEVTTVQRTVRNRQSTRTKLLDAAERIITLRGPHHAGVNSVAAE